jgi:hypothetical protein
MLPVEEERLVGPETYRLCRMVSKAYALRGVHVHTAQPLHYISHLSNRIVKAHLQFKSLVLEDLDITFHSWRSLSASHCACPMVR